MGIGIISAKFGVVVVCCSPLSSAALRLMWRLRGGLWPWCCSQSESPAVVLIKPVLWKGAVYAACPTLSLFLSLAMGLQIPASLCFPQSCVNMCLFTAVKEASCLCLACPKQGYLWVVSLTIMPLLQRSFVYGFSGPRGAPDPS